MKTTLILICLIFALSFTSVNANHIQPISNKASKTTEITITYTEYIYKRVLIGNTWWIFVYTTEGSFIMAYPDED